MLAWCSVCAGGPIGLGLGLCIAVLMEITSHSIPPRKKGSGEPEQFDWELLVRVFRGETSSILIPRTSIATSGKSKTAHSRSNIGSNIELHGVPTKHFGDMASH
jgi:hypothetical protein